MDGSVDRKVKTNLFDGSINKERGTLCYVNIKTILNFLTNQPAPDLIDHSACMLN